MKKTTTKDPFLQARRELSSLLEAASNKGNDSAFREQTEKTLETTILHPEVVETYKRLIKKRLK